MTEMRRSEFSHRSRSVSRMTQRSVDRVSVSRGLSESVSRASTFLTQEVHCDQVWDLEVAQCQRIYSRQLREYETKWSYREASKESDNLDEIDLIFFKNLLLLSGRSSVNTLPKQSFDRRASVKLIHRTVEKESPFVRKRYQPDQLVRMKKGNPWPTITTNGASSPAKNGVTVNSIERAIQGNGDTAAGDSENKKKIKSINETETTNYTHPRVVNEGQINVIEKLDSADKSSIGLKPENIKISAKADVQVSHKAKGNGTKFEEENSVNARNVLLRNVQNNEKRNSTSHLKPGISSGPSKVNSNVSQKADLENKDTIAMLKSPIAMKSDDSVLIKESKTAVKKPEIPTAKNSTLEKNNEINKSKSIEAETPSQNGAVKQPVARKESLVEKLCDRFTQIAKYSLLSSSSTSYTVNGRNQVEMAPQNEFASMKSVDTHSSNTQCSAAKEVSTKALPAAGKEAFGMKSVFKIWQELQNRALIDSDTRLVRGGRSQKALTSSKGTDAPDFPVKPNRFSQKASDASVSEQNKDGMIETPKNSSVAVSECKLIVEGGKVGADMTKNSLILRSSSDKKEISNKCNIENVKDLEAPRKQTFDNKGVSRSASTTMESQQVNASSYQSSIAHTTPEGDLPTRSRNPTLFRLSSVKELVSSLQNGSTEPISPTHASPSFSPQRTPLSLSKSNSEDIGSNKLQDTSTSIQRFPSHAQKILEQTERPKPLPRKSLATTNQPSMPLKSPTIPISPISQMESFQKHQIQSLAEQDIQKSCQESSVNPTTSENKFVNQNLEKQIAAEPVDKVEADLSSNIFKDKIEVKRRIFEHVNIDGPRPPPRLRRNAAFRKSTSTSAAETLGSKVVASQSFDSTDFVDRKHGTAVTREPLDEISSLVSNSAQSEIEKATINGSENSRPIHLIELSNSESVSIRPHTLELKSSSYPVWSNRDSVESNRSNMNSITSSVFRSSVSSTDSGISRGDSFRQSRSNYDDNHQVNQSPSSSLSSLNDITYSSSTILHLQSPSPLQPDSKLEELDSPGEVIRTGSVRRKISICRQGDLMRARSIVETDLGARERAGGVENRSTASIRLYQSLDFRSLRQYYK